MCNERYVRQQSFAPIGSSGQALLHDKHVLIIGAGALGSGNAEILARSGVGKLTIVDRDYVDWSNLQRQTLYCEQDAKEQLPKAVAAARRLRQINASIQIDAEVLDCTAVELIRLVEASKVDLIIDSTDNFSIRYMINDIAYKYKIPWLYGACSGSYGVMCSFLPHQQTPCLHCLLSSMPVSAANCEINGIIAPAVQMVVSLQSAEALKWLTGNEESMSNSFRVFDLWSSLFQTIQISSSLRQEQCNTCGNDPSYPFLQEVASMKTETLCGRSTVWIRPSRVSPLDLEQVIESAQKRSSRVTSNPYLVQIHEEEYRLVIFKDGRALIHGTADPLLAKELYYRYLG
ncbi:ThiF family adenylyltransferase [Paenibacillus crassostreae]|uniref:Thiamine biosynthesis protein ThiF n=1 Tax=Paenibacillus crassostreae TaxID=1763538 RepID=A0A167DKL5_9BACL|nr:ThiF family adenylyltransferase [Paenibacillus crassostreae]AOZ91343.1 thiamine biosynthesis protein ThiF [Paenibacillus crassostreae]OAB74498.1 thiamine biosynthesis protein ThiF [Paenibacillus crassostreae]